MLATSSRSRHIGRVCNRLINCLPVIHCWGANTRPQCVLFLLGEVVHHMRTIPSVRTISPSKWTILPLWEQFVFVKGQGDWQNAKSNRCGIDSAAAAFLCPASEKALRSRAFRQNEKVGNFYQNYLPFMAKECYFDKMKVIVIYWYDLYLPGRTAIKHLPKIGELWYTTSRQFVIYRGLDYRLPVRWDSSLLLRKDA